MDHKTVERVAWAIYDAISYSDVLKGDLSDGYIVAIEGKVDFEACARAAIESYRKGIGAAFIEAGAVEHDSIVFKGGQQ